MDVHKNARSCPASRALLVERVLEQGWSVAAAAEAIGVSRRTGWKWLSRYRTEGAEGLRDRSSRPRRVRRIGKRLYKRIVDLRHRRLTCRRIGLLVGRSRATVARVVGRVGLSRLRNLDPVPPVQRYERSRPGELLHIDIKKLGRIERVGHRVTGDRRGPHLAAGWEFAYVCVDDASRIAYAEVLHDQGKATAVAFLRRTVQWFQNMGVIAERVMTDNGGCFVSRMFRAACASLELRHLRTKPYTPRTNGKVERLIQTLGREWAYALIYPSSQQRTAMLLSYLHFYNHHRAHSALGDQPPISRLAMNNLVRHNN
ncbi:MAG: IS481 family transposase [Acidobacteria bacterium]|nr:MAG: IS481 family transposase [Acidobacteriota bacterium]